MYGTCLVYIKYELILIHHILVYRATFLLSIRLFGEFLYDFGHYSEKKYTVFVSVYNDEACATMVEMIGSSHSKQLELIYFWVTTQIRLM